MCQSALSSSKGENWGIGVQATANTSTHFRFSVEVHQRSGISLLLFVVVDTVSRDLHGAVPWTLLYGDGVVLLACVYKTEPEQQATSE